MRPNHHCPACGKDVLKVITAAGRQQLLNPNADGAGNVAVYRDGAGTLRARVPHEDHPLMPWEHVYMPHQATCKGRQLSIPAPRPVAAVQTQTASVSSLIDYRRDRTKR